LIPAGATITDVRWKVEDSKAGDLSVTQNLAQPTLNGSNYGANKSTNRLVTDADAEQIYTLSSLPSVADINAGHLGIDLQYTQEVWNTNWNDPANYSIAFPDGTTDPEITVEVNYTHGGTPPPYAYINLTSTAEAYLGTTGSPASSAPWSGTATADNGLDATVTDNVYVDLLNPDVTVIDSSTKRIKITLTSGLGTYLLTRNAFGTVDPPNDSNIGILGTYSASATFSPVVPSTVRVDNVAVQICYTVDSTVLSKWSKFCFTSNGKYVAIRDTGTIDLVEKDFRNNGVYIGGSNRDGGLTPPSWKFVTQQIQWDGAKARLASVQYHGKSNTDLIDAAVSVDDNNYISGTLEGITTSKWYKFHPSNSSGMRHNIKFEGNESDSDLQGFALEFNVQSRGKPK
jgi:hypothetical protein